MKGRQAPSGRKQAEAGALRVVFAVLGAVVVLIVAGAVGGVFYVRDQLNAPSDIHGKVVDFTVRDGEGLDQLAEDLASHGLIRNGFVFRQYAKFKGLGDNLHPGRFKLDDGMGATAIIVKLEGRPDTIGRRAVLTEGMTARQMAKAISDADPEIDRQAYLDEVKAGIFAEPFLAIRPSTLEGFLFPDSYDIPEHASAHDVVQMQLQAFATKAEPYLQPTPGEAGYHLLVLASIVEREAKFEQDRPVVAGILLNRLAKNMPLQVDASVLYGAGIVGRGPTAQELATDTPYNTYLHPGLPPTPISNPGAETIRAVISVHAGDTPYLYYVSDKCGHNHYATTLAQHQQNIAVYRDAPCVSPSASASPTPAD